MGVVPIGPGDGDIASVALGEPVPFLIAEDVVVESVERGEPRGAMIWLLRGRCRPVLFSLTGDEQNGGRTGDAGGDETESVHGNLLRRESSGSRINALARLSQVVAA